ncbi:MAG TPA: prolyl oligopeptidase family serine peptidase [Pyrinomonadaceae bacterium]|nr:prolyl oligopeptidase family serine peptidase [Pyrinomonadaceae bacterium]
MNAVHQSLPRASARFARAFVLFVFALWVAAPCAAQTTYQKPPQAVLDVLNAPVPPTASISPARDYMLLLQGVRYPPITDLAQPMLRLAGLRINPSVTGPHRGLYYVGASVKKLADGSEQKVELPAGAQMGVPAWSADGRRFAFTNTTPAGIELWVGDAARARAHRVKDVWVNAVIGAPTQLAPDGRGVGSVVQWMPDNRTLLVRLVPSKRGAAPAETNVPRGPNVQESSGRPGPVRTYQDLLRNPYDESLFEYYATAQLALVDSDGGRVTPVGQPAVFDSIDISPDGKFVLVERVQRPYSYLHTYNAFPREVEIWDASGRLAHKVASVPLADQVPIEGVVKGPRAFEWRPNEAATLLWAEALDEGDPRRKVSHRDRLMTLKAPFKDAPAELFKTEHRYTGASWGERGELFVRDYDRDRRWTRTQLIDADNPSAAPRTIWSHSSQERYNHPGTPLMRTLPTGQRVIHRQGDWLFLSGAGSTPEGDRPFLDRFDLRTLKADRLFRSDDKSYEGVVALLKDDGSQFLTRRESPTDPPNYFVWSGVGEQGRSPAPRALTDFPDPTPQLKGVTKRLVKYKRADGVDLSFTLYLPPGYKEGTRLPTVVWAYPLEFTDPGTAGQVSGSTQRYTTITGPSHLFYLLAGYAVMDNATMPIVGDPETMNNTYIEQIVSSAKAAIDKGVELGVTDPNRVGVGGHSYGAFMTANLLAHSDLFRAGVARSGAYNRTLTPFGFQSERRTLWEAPELYIKVSPFMVANKINEPILLIHGEADNNSGTFPIQSERLYQALRGTGGTVRYVTLPLESHGYAARESTEHALYEMLTWFDKYVKNATPREATER